MWELGILGGLFIFDVLLVFMYMGHAKNVVNSYTWINEKQLELIGNEEANDLVEEIEGNLQLFAGWLTQTKNIIVPGILFVQLVSAYVIGDLMDQNLPTQFLSNLVAWGQAGVIVASFVLAQRTRDSLMILYKINEEYIKLTVLKKADEIEAQEDHLNGE